MAAQGLVLTPARWATWVAQRHEWNGYLWIRWSDAEAVLLFIAGRPRIHLWSPDGWAEGEHALTAVAQRLDRLPPPRWGQVAIPARWAAALRDLTLLQPALPAEVAPPEAWIAWARSQRFTGLAVLVGDVAGAWIAHDGTIRAVRFQQGTVVVDDPAAQAGDGLLQVYRGRVMVELPALPDQEPPVEMVRPEPSPTTEFVRGRSEALRIPARAEEVAEAAAEEVPGVPQATEGPGPGEAVPPPPGAPDVVPPPLEPAVPAAPAASADEPGASAPGGSAPASQEIIPPVSTPPAAAPPTPVAAVSPSAPADSGEITVDQAGSETPRRFRGDERFLLAPTVDLANPEALGDLLAAHGTGMLRWLPLLDGTRTLEDVSRAGAVTLVEVDRVVAALADRRLVFRYTARPRAPAAS